MKLDFVVLARIEAAMNQRHHGPINTATAAYGRDALDHARSILWENWAWDAEGNPDLAMSGEISEDA